MVQLIGPLVILAALLLLAWPRLRRQGRRLTDAAGPSREMAAASYWAAVRAEARGLDVADIQETVCRETGCSPVEADRAIALVLSDAGPASSHRRV